MISLNRLVLILINKKVVFVIFLLSLIALSPQAQNTVNTKELSLLFRNVDQFGLVYKFGKENKFWQIGGMSVIGRYSSNPGLQVDESDHVLGISFMLGREFRKNIASKLNLIYGIDLNLTYFLLRDESKYKPPIVDQDTDIKWIRYSPGLAFSLGANYELSQNFLFGIAMNVPSISIIFEFVEGKIGNLDTYKTESRTINYGISNINSSVFLSYRF